MSLGEAIWSQLAGVLRGLFQWLIDLLMGVATPVLDALVGFLQSVVPESANVDITLILPYLGAVNAWVPIDFAVGLFFSWLGWVVFYSSTRWILRLIPGIG